MSCGTSGQYLFQIFRGDDFALRIEITDLNDEPVNVMGWSFKATMKLNTEEPDEKAPVKVDIGPVTGEDAEQGIVFLLLPSDQTKHLKPTVYHFDLQREALGTVATVFAGKVRVHSDVTRRHG